MTGLPDVLELEVLCDECMAATSGSSCHTPHKGDDTFKNILNKSTMHCQALIAIPVILHHTEYSDILIDIAHIPNNAKKLNEFSRKLHVLTLQKTNE
jgi:hypothetical protein